MNNNKECIIVIPTEYTPLNNDIKVFTDNYTQTGTEEEEGDCGICIVCLWWSLLAFLMYIILCL